MNDQTGASRDAAVKRPEDENLGVTANLMYGLQHVLTMYGGIVAVPLIVAEAAGMSAADAGLLVTACLFMGGVATLLQTLGIPFFGCRLPLVQGVSFAGVATMVSILHTGGGMQGVLGAVMYASVLGLIIAPVFSRITKFFPPLVNGCVITVIGMSLMPVAAHWAMGGNAKSADYGSMGNIGLAGLSLFMVLLFSKLGNAMLSRPSSSARPISRRCSTAPFLRCPHLCTSAGPLSTWRPPSPCSS